MKFSRRHRQHAVVEASSLSDILFFLLLFFLMISTMASPDAIKLFLPQSKTAQHVPKGTVSLSVNAQKQYFIDGQRTDLQDVEAAIKEKATQKNADAVVLRMDKSLSITDLTQAYDFIADLNLKVVLATDPKK